MFGWNFQKSKSDRIKLFLFILVTFLIVGFSLSALFRVMNNGSEETAAVDHKEKREAESTDKVDSEPSSSTEDKSTEEQKNEYDQTERFSKEDLEVTKDLAVKFTKAFHTYSIDEPTKYLKDAKPYMTDALYKKMKQNGRREVLDRSYLTVKKTEVTPVTNTSEIVVRWNVMVTGEAKSNDGKTSETEDWYLVGLRKVDDDWKVEDVRVNVPS
ncbi:hypothetical protein P4472_02195 [Bacillus subtilis]|nr:hypothetical protein [Bacillus subtilis]MEC0363553.1 hypothetical protein [Bacillus subtilis]MED3600841.1 hypothetical protein [Bacillus subtilis]MED3692588.1 hypothetical protein [Bacillus subtilis]